MNKTTQASPLLRTVTGTPTDVWNDSCSPAELEYAIANGAVGATTNPSIVLGVLKHEMPAWRDWIIRCIADNPTADEDAIAWKLIEAMGLKGAELLRDVFAREKGMRGRLSIQTNPVLWRNADALVEQAVHFASLAPNIQVKIPVTAAGVAAIEEATYRGVNINATVSFTVPQAIAVAEAMERGLKRREAAGLETASMTPVCTLMVGRLDDWIKFVAKRDGIVTTPGLLDWAGVAVMKHAYEIYQARNYRARLLVAAFRNHLHWSEFIGGDVVLTITHEWQVLFNNCDVVVKNRIDDPVDPATVAELKRRFADFRRAYDEDGMTPAEFDQYGATVRTLHSFIEAYREISSVVRNFMLPPVG
jgi:transaldolase